MAVPIDQARWTLVGDCRNMLLEMTMAQLVQAKAALGAIMVKKGAQA